MAFVKQVLGDAFLFSSGQELHHLYFHNELSSCNSLGRNFELPRRQKSRLDPTLLDSTFEAIPISFHFYLKLSLISYLKRASHF